MVKRSGLIGVSVAFMCVVGSGSAGAVQIRQEPQAVAAPTQPVTIRPLDNPLETEDNKSTKATTSTKESRDLETIVNKNLIAQNNGGSLESIVDKSTEIPAASTANTAKKPTPTTVVPAKVIPVRPAPVQAVPAAPVVIPVQTPAVRVDSADAVDTKNVKPETSAGSESFMTSVRVFAIRWREVLDILFVGSITLFTGLLYRVSRNQNEMLARSVQAAQDAAHAAQRSALIAQRLVGHEEHYDESQASLELS